MIVLFVALEDAEVLRQRSEDLESVRYQLDAQLRLERLLPHNELPYLCYRIGDEGIGIDVYDEHRASEMIAAMDSSATRSVEERRQRRLRKARTTHARA